MGTHNELGKLGEEKAREYLLEKKYKIIDMNWRHGKWEIDLVASKDNITCLIEVKTRSSPFESIDEIIPRSKEMAILDAANAYMESNSLNEECRIDLILVEKKENKFDFTHIENAITQA